MDGWYITEQRDDADSDVTQPHRSGLVIRAAQSSRVATSSDS